MRWGPSKVYSGEWYHGQRSGTGKYISDKLPEDMKIVYEGNGETIVLTEREFGAKATLILNFM